jgi:hypothetical protein
MAVRKTREKKNTLGAAAEKIHFFISDRMIESTDRIKFFVKLLESAVPKAGVLSYLVALFLIWRISSTFLRCAKPLILSQLM